MKQAVKESKIGQANEQENKLREELKLYFLRKKEKEEENHLQLVSDFLRSKPILEETYYVFCEVEYGDYTDDTDEEGKLDKITDGFECYVNAISEEDAMLKVEDIFEAEYDHYDFNVANATYARPLNIDQVNELTQRTDLRKKYSSFETDYVLCRSQQS